MKFEKTALSAIRFRAASTGEAFVPIDIVSFDLGGPIDFEEVLAALHTHGLITWHREAEALTLTEKGRREEPPQTRRRRLGLYERMVATGRTRRN